jgi:hypothetical protein
MGVHSMFFNSEINYTIGKFDFSTGVQYVEKGFNTNFISYTSSITQHTTYQYRLHYLEVPFNFKIKKKFILGIIGSYLFDDDYRYAFKQTQFKPDGEKRYQYEVAYQFPFPERYKQFDFGINVGYNYRFSDALSAEITIQKHLINIDKWNSIDLRYNFCLLAGLRYNPF